MLQVLDNYLNQLHAEITNYERLLSEKKQEAEKISDIQGQVAGVLDTLKDAVDRIRTIDPKALDLVKMATLEIFADRHQNKPDEDSKSPITEDIAIKENPTEKAPEAPQPEQLSEAIAYDSATSTTLIGCNAKSRAKTWGDWLCYIHTVGERYTIRKAKHLSAFKYELVVEGITKRTYLERLAKCNFAKSPDHSDNSSWKPEKKQPIAAPPPPRTCHPHELQVGDTACNSEGKTYKILGVSENGTEVDVINEDEMKMCLPTGALYMHKKADLNDLLEVEDIAPSEGLEIGRKVRVVSGRRPEFYNELGTITNISGLGAHVALPTGENRVFMNSELRAA